jgi:hypothetical protein
MTSLGFSHSRTEPSLFVNKSTGVTVLVHVDDMMFFGSKEAVVKFVNDLQAHVKTSAPVYLEATGDTGRMLSRTITRTSRGFMIQTDHKHAESIVRDIVLPGQKSSATPGRKLTGQEKESMAAAIDPVRAALFKCNVGRLIYMSLERPELQYAVKYLASELSNPSEGGWFVLNGVARFLMGRESIQIAVEVSMEGGKAPTIVHAFADSNWAGAEGGDSNRKSTSGGVVFWGDNVLGTFSRTQQTYALSSCEAEVYGAVSTAAEGLYTAALLADLGFVTRVKLHTDSSSSLNLLSKPGMSRPMRHMEVKYLFLQDLVSSKRITGAKVLGTQNPADLLTKFITTTMMAAHLSRFRIKFVNLADARKIEAFQTKKVLPT